MTLVSTSQLADVDDGRVALGDARALNRSLEEIATGQLYNLVGKDPQLFRLAIGNFDSVKFKPTHCPLEIITGRYPIPRKSLIEVTTGEK